MAPHSSKARGSLSRIWCAAALGCVGLWRSHVTTFSFTPSRRLRIARDVSRAALVVREDASLWSIHLGDEVSGSVTNLNELSADIDMGLDSKLLAGNLFISNWMPSKDGNIGEVFKVGDEVTARVRDITKLKGYRRWCLVLASADHPAFAKKPFTDFKLGQALTGTVLRKTRNMLFLDVGAVKDAGIGINEAGNLAVGDKLEVRVSSVSNARLVLLPAATMKVVGDKVTGRVVALHPPFSVDIDVGTGLPATLHLSNWLPGDGKQVDDLFKVGDEVTARVRGVKKDDRYRDIYELASADHPVFEFTPLTDFELRQQVTGKVLSGDEKYVYVDIDAVAVGAVPREEAGVRREGEAVELEVVRMSNDGLTLVPFLGPSMDSSAQDSEDV
eukprot:gb/GFBE01003284.1/.p1 GENE.gb/GFBE01003284.1/~~gb/GFBE01003284.1/.p1  ORF type:complete len:387 (+),score=67.27 gb/GFBE01003284.1/:1-1161(+)